MVTTRNKRDIKTKKEINMQKLKDWKTVEEIAKQLRGEGGEG